MAELITEGVCNTVDLTPFRLERFGASDSKGSKKRGRKQGAVEVGEQW